MWTYNNTNELYHFGVPGMKWGHRKAVDTSGTGRSGKSRNAVSISAAGHKALAKVYSINEKTYSKSNKTLSSMNAAAKNAQLKKAEQAQKKANDRKAIANENKRLRKEAKKQSYGNSIKKTIGRDVGIIGASVVVGSALGLTGHEKAMNAVAKIGNYALTASNVAGAADLGMTFARRNGYIK